MKRPKRPPMWIIRDGEIIRIRDFPGLPPAPCVEGRIVPKGSEA